MSEPHAAAVLQRAAPPKTRRSEVYRHELKYRISYAEKAALELRLAPLLRRDVRFVHPFAQAVVHRSPGGAVNIPRLAGAQNKTSIQRSYSSIIRPIF